MLFVLSAPSGAGKTTIARHILERFPALNFSVSATTRSQRPGETDGKDYYFLSREEFEQRIVEGGLIEWEEIYGNLYGTLFSQTDEIMRQGKHVLFDIDVKGALSIKQIYGDMSVLIFIQPPNLDILRQRLIRRSTDNSEIIERRMQRAVWEIEQTDMFDHVVVNDDLKVAVSAVETLIELYQNKKPES